ncbi:MAG: DUF896 domain-containing protein [Peptoniphilus sp.]|nr:DUF896 domain-containing protein [Peptoniphilus sp.]MDY3118153.1 DUF896 domain-containing protein [Peptoniphilus sp.]
MENIEKLLKRINELAREAKVRELTEEEIAERDRLRKAYVKIFREGFRQQLLHTKIVDEAGNDITPEKLKHAKAEQKEKER